MSLIHFLVTLLLLVVNIAGLSAFVTRFVPSVALARAAGILLFCLLFFFGEHFAGLGRLTWLWPITTVAAILILYIDRERLLVQGFWRAERVFLVALGYGLAWKLAFPEIYPTSERVTDLVFIGNYLPGDRLPPLDHWLPPSRFDFYYGFQHYGAALMGRIFGMGPGLTYNLAFALLMALPIALAWDFAERFLARRWARWLVVVTFTLGGTGATPFAHLSYDAPAGQDIVDRASDSMWASQRFIGQFDQRLNTEFGRALFPGSATADWVPRELPSENFGYQFHVGDYHPPLGGFFLLLMAIAAIGVVETARPAQRSIDGAASRIGMPNEPNCAAQSILALTVPAAVATNTWVFPLQGALVLGWIGWRCLDRRPPDWKALMVGGLGGFLLLYPFLAGFAARALATPIKLVQTQDHTPSAQFLAVHWPVLLFSALAFWQKETRRIALLFAVVFLGLLLVSELIYVDDPTSGQYERTNTTMKWWGWIWSGAAVALTVPLLACSRRWVRWLTVASLITINLYAFDVARYSILTGKDGFGQLEAHGVYTSDDTVREVFRYLSSAPYGIVLENCYGDAYSDSGVYAAFAAKPSLLGWPMHLMTWHGSVGHVWALKEEILRFYAGTLPDAAEWLIANKVDYVVWNYKDQALQPGAWQSLNQAIGESYGWTEFQSNPDVHVGLWVRHP